MDGTRVTAAGGLHQDWQEFIGRARSATRYLNASADTLFRSSHAGNDVETANFLQCLADAQASTALLARLYYLTDPEVEHFFAEVLPSLLRAMSHATAGVQETMRGGVRGKVSWPQTLQARVAGRVDIATFIVRRVEKSADLPENQLTRLYLEAVIRTVSETEALIGTGAVLKTLKTIRDGAETALKSPYLQAVTRARRPTPLMYQRARRNRNWRYGKVADLTRLYDEGIRRGKWETVLRLLARGWLSPVETDDLFELFVLILVLEVLEDEMGFGVGQQYALIRAGRSHVAEYHHPGNGFRALVHFDQSPSAALSLPPRKLSEYTSLLDDYTGVTGTERRPDILLRFIPPDGTVGERRVLLEVKESTDAQYKRDSVYKALAYLRDFGGLWNAGPPQQPKAILMFPEKVALKAGARDAGRDLVFAVAADANGERNRLATLLSAAAGIPSSAPPGTIV